MKNSEAVDVEKKKEIPSHHVDFSTFWSDYGVVSTVKKKKVYVPCGTTVWSFYNQKTYSFVAGKDDKWMEFVERCETSSSVVHRV